MSDASDTEGAILWHRQFAAAANNLAWDLSEQTRNAAQDREMLDAAHAASAAAETAQYRASYALAAAALEAVSNEKERGIVAKTFGHVPKPKTAA
jgi:hypothetical protein